MPKRPDSATRSSRLGRRLGIVLALACSSMVLGLSGPPAQALVAKTTFASTGGEQQYVVPPGTLSIVVHAVGGQGGCQWSGPLLGSDIVATVAVTPGQVIYVEVGGNGTSASFANFGDPSPGGFNGGGTGLGTGGGGGGASDVRTAPRAATGSLDTRLVVAGGGGGGGGLNGECANASETAGVGGPGTQSSGGAPGTTTTACPVGTAGTLGTGGDGGLGTDCEFAGGGGGGGGWYGGGGGGPGTYPGSVGAAGGAGSSAAPTDPGAVVRGDGTGVPMIEITPVVADPTVSATTVNFSPLAVGKTSTAVDLSISNFGSAPLTISDVAFTGPQATDYFVTSSTCGAPVAPSAACHLGVAYTAKDGGPRLATLVVTTNVGVRTVNLIGAGISNQFSFLKVTRNKSKGTAKVYVTTAGPGGLTLTAVGVRSQAKTITGTTAALLVNPKRKLRTILESVGKVSVRVKVTFTPTGGEPLSKKKWVKLVLA